MKEIPLTRGMVALVDDEDYERMGQHKWCTLVQPRRSVYAVRYDKEHNLIYMHCEIMPTRPGLVVDHINGNGIDNRHENLRYCTNSQNLLNRIAKPRNGYRGITPGRNGKWRAYCHIGGQFKALGTYPTPEAAALAWNKAIIDAGLAEFATLNQVPEQTR